MTDPVRNPSQALEPCPFCGNAPQFSGDAADWKDDHRYVNSAIAALFSLK